jgi:hypothetical protein
MKLLTAQYECYSHLSAQLSMLSCLITRATSLPLDYVPCLPIRWGHPDTHCHYRLTQGIVTIPGASPKLLFNNYILQHKLLCWPDVCSHAGASWES